MSSCRKRIIIKSSDRSDSGASGILSFDGWGDASDGFGSSSSSSAHLSYSGYDEAGISTPTYFIRFNW
jgi:hypothetical protein